MVRDRDAAAMRVLGDPERLGKAATCEVDLGEADAALIDQALEAAHRALLLARREALRDAVGHPAVAGDVVGMQRLLDPEEAVGLERLRALDRGRRVPD